MAKAHDKATLHDWARSIPATALLAGTMISCDIPLRAVGKLLGREPMVDAGHLLAHMLWQAFALTGAKLEVSGLEHIDPDERYLIVANHQGFSDVIVIATALQGLKPRYVAKRELARGWPSISYLITASGSAVIDRKHPDAAIAEIERLGRDARREGWNVAIFPEGTRAKDGVARTWKLRGTKALLDAAQPGKVLPVSLVGGSELFAHNGLPFTADVRMRCQVHPAIDPPTTAISMLTPRPPSPTPRARHPRSA